MPNTARTDFRTMFRVFASALAAVALAGASAIAHAAKFDLTRAELASLAVQAASVEVSAATAKAVGTVEVVEYYNATLTHYFITADATEKQLLDGGAFGGVWKRTGKSFQAWAADGAPSGTAPVCRFFGTDRYRANGTRIGPRSHFYTAYPFECDFVKTAWQSIANDGQSYPAWSFETNAFAAKLPVNGTCEAGTQPLYRAFNNAISGDPNHRYVTDPATFQSMPGWTNEGLAMCLPATGGGSLALPAPIPGCGADDCPPGTPVGSGVGLVNLAVTLTNPTATAQTLVIPRGTTFLSRNVIVQDGMAAETLSLTVPAGQTRSFVVAVFCLQASRDPSFLGVLYDRGPVTSSANLMDIATLADGKLGTLDSTGFKRLAVQLAIWEVTDGPGSLSGTLRGLLVTLLATPDSSPDTIATLFQQIQALTLGPLPGL